MDNKLNHNARFYTALSFILCIAPAAIFAEEATKSVDDEQEDQLPAYVVVATRTPLSLDRVSPSVNYVSEEEFEFWQDRDLVDTLNRQTGMTVVTSGGIGAQTSLFTRGADSNHTAFFIDGRRVNVGFGNQYSLEYLNLGNLSSVQIQRGASSVHYGSSGIGGVVEMRTKSGLHQRDATGSLSTELGSNDYYRGAFATVYGTESFGFSVAGSALTTDNEHDNDDFDSAFINGRFDYRLTDEFSLELLTLYSDSEKELPGSVYSPKPDDKQDTEIWMVSPGVRYATDDLSVHLFYARSESQADLDQVNEAFSSSSPYPSLGFYPISNEIEVLSDEVNLQIDYSIDDNTLVSFGGIYRDDEASNSNLTTFSPLDPPTSYSQDFEQVGAYAQVLHTISAFEIRAGVRYDDYSEFDDQVTGNLELIYNIDSIDAAVFGKVATSYAPPGADQIAFDTNQFFSDESTELEPEESTSYELGWRQSLLDNTVTYSVLFFHNDIDHLIDFVFDPMTYNSDAVNVEEATTEGVEFEVQYTGIEDLELSLGYTYLTAVADYQDDPRTPLAGSPDPAKDVRLARRARHMLHAAAIYQFTDALAAGIHVQGNFDRQDFDPNTFVLVDAEDYFVVNLVADWAVNDSWSVFARAENLFDEEYSPAEGYPALGRAGYLGLRYKF